MVKNGLDNASSSPTNGLNVYCKSVNKRLSCNYSNHSGYRPLGIFLAGLNNVENISASVYFVLFGSTILC